MDAVTYRYYEPRDEEGIVQLLNQSFKGWPKQDIDPLDYWKWKYIDNPYWMNDIGVAQASGEIVGCKHSVYFRIKLGENTYFCSLGSDMAVHKDHREKGVSNELSAMSSKKKIENGYDMSYFVSSNPIVIEKYKDNPTLPHGVIVYALIKDIDKQLENMPMKNPLVKKAAFKGAETLNIVKRALTKSEPVTNNITVKQVTGFDKQINHFWENLAPSYDFIVYRDQEYLNWRYADPRAGKHEIYIAEEDSKIVGYCVNIINSYRKEYPVGFIVDLLCHPDRHDAMSALILKSLEYFEDNNINIITTLAVEGSPLEVTLSQAGFLNTMEKLKVFFGLKAKEASAQSIIKRSSPRTLHFCYGDIDSLPAEIKRGNDG